MTAHEISPPDEKFGSSSTNVERKLDLLDRFTRLSLANGIYSSYADSCAIKSVQEGPDSAEWEHARRMELPLIPVSQYVKMPTVSTIRFSLSRVDPDELRIIEGTEVEVGVYAREYLGKPVEAFGVIFPQFDNFQAQLVKEYAFLLDPQDNEEEI